MPVQRVILVNVSRLLADMLRRIIHRSDHLEMVQEACAGKVLPDAMECCEACWVVLSLSPEKNFPSWVGGHIAKYPATRFLAISPGSNKIRLKGLDYEAEIEDISLQDLLHILEGYPQHA